MQLRDYQVEAAKVAANYLNSPVAEEPKVMVLPTAWGKSVLIAHAVKSVKGKKVLVLQPSKELLEQNYSKYLSLGLTATIYSASLNTKEISDVTFATIGSIKDLGHLFSDFGAVIVDEVHLYPRAGDSMFQKFLKASGITRALGLTATPFKLQTYAFGSKLVMLTSWSKAGNFFKDILYVSQVKDIIDRGYWAKIKYVQESVNTKQLVFNSTGSDYTDKSQNQFYESNCLDSVIKYKLGSEELESRKHILVFVPSVEEAVSLSTQVKNSAAISAETPKKEREDIIRAFKAGKIRTIFNVNILSVGFDYPEIDCIIMARPTASLAWYYQVLGRGTRIHPNKKDCMVLDLSGNFNKFGMIEDLIYEKVKRTWKLFGSDEKLLTGIYLSEIGTVFRSASETKSQYTEGVLVKRSKWEKPYTHMTFGKHKGMPLKDVPVDYLKWYVGVVTDIKEWQKPVVKAMQKEIDNRAKALPPVPVASLF
jgi:DNA repair protein RadD